MKVIPKITVNSIRIFVNSHSEFKVHDNRFIFWNKCCNEYTWDYLKRAKPLILQNIYFQLLKHVNETKNASYSSKRP